MLVLKERYVIIEKKMEEHLILKEMDSNKLSDKVPKTTTKDGTFTR
jgi:hypothetical protein